MRLSFIRAAATASLLVPLVANAFGIDVLINGKTVTFVDVSQSSWYAPFVRDAAQAGIVNGYMDASGNFTGKFGPENNVTMAEALKIAVESAGYDAQAYGAVVDSSVNHWASEYVSVAILENFEFIKNPYRLDRAATRGEVAAMFTSAFRVNVPASPSGTTFNDVQLATPYAASVEALARDSVVSGDTTNGQPTGTYRPLALINRAEVVKIAMNSRAKYGQPGKDRTPSQPTTSNVVTYANGTFSPMVLTVPLGTMVTFHNGSLETVWVASNPHPTHTGYPAFDSKADVAAGQDFSFTFNQRGTWGYHNHHNPKQSGTIVVE